MFTCISCRVAFETADEQRAHFGTDWHRYNMKRRVANLPPVIAAAFNEKVLERREQNAIRTDPRGLVCTACSKSFSTENAYRSHVQSRKHRERERAYLSGPPSGIDSKESAETVVTVGQSSRVDGVSDEEIETISEVDEDSGDESMDDSDIEQRIASSRRRIKNTDCLFCAQQAESIDVIVSHMTRYHSFFIPDREHLVDLPGLLSYLGEKVVLGNLCLYCPNGGKEFPSLEAVRRHMVDKSHCKIAYDSDEDRAELIDYYDFDVVEGGSDWEDVDMDDEITTDDVTTTGTASLAADGLSLILPSGRILGHRSLRVYYDQRFRPQPLSSGSDANTSKVERVRQRLADPSLALVPIAGGHGAYGRGLQVIKARNAGEAAWARREGRSFKDQRRREEHRTKVGYIHNSQKHFRDPLLQ